MENNPRYDLEEGSELRLDFTKLSAIAKTGQDCIPVAVQDSETGEVILIAYTNRPAFETTVDTGIATFWSTSRNELWIKGKTSGNTFEVKRILVNCEQNSLVYVVKPKKSGICHTKNKNGDARNCYYREYNRSTKALENLDP
ncbi:MAG: phosphoribosyl-AMP cyclohydrolase [Spirochaetales bacterium]|nr:phosphoribosyl-AMP cyclohydrolase [Spirochaetales bacterium]